MKKKTFTEKQIEEIRRLLEKKVSSSKEKKKSIRNKIRRLDFYISDFRSKKEEFTQHDFDELIDEKKILIKN